MPEVPAEWTPINAGMSRMVPAAGGLQSWGLQEACGGWAPTRGICTCPAPASFSALTLGFLEWGGAPAPTVGGLCRSPRSEEEQGSLPAQQTQRP